MAILQRNDRALFFLFKKTQLIKILTEVFRDEESISTFFFGTKPCFIKNRAGSKKLMEVAFIMQIQGLQTLAMSENEQLSN
ncbi:hypothetical protein SAMN05421680_10743 [Xenorhabdus mauleonii]|uniref:Uncharacterized protein n=1 Tax=Xenorhabdus mauleonii TaxID=351675 RepID=A0A1I3Q544_9GAMM|nr:hypothetical protein SAMN05421680_10743 [Xenorhabdus mauleonii]